MDWNACNFFAQTHRPIANMHAYACSEDIAKKVYYEYKLGTSYAALYLSRSNKIICLSWYWAYRHRGQRLIGACALETRKCNPVMQQSCF